MAKYCPLPKCRNKTGLNSAKAKYHTPLPWKKRRYSYIHSKGFNKQSCICIYMVGILWVISYISISWSANEDCIWGDWALGGQNLTRIASKNLRILGEIQNSKPTSPRPLHYVKWWSSTKRQCMIHLGTYRWNVKIFSCRNYGYYLTAHEEPCISCADDRRYWHSQVTSQCIQCQCPGLRQTGMKLGYGNQQSQFLLSSPDLSLKFCEIPAQWEFHSHKYWYLWCQDVFLMHVRNTLY